VAAFSRKRLLCHGSPAIAPDLAPPEFWLSQNSKDVLKSNCLSDLEDIKPSVKRNPRNSC
jgi:hypothetical protein